MTAIKKAKLSPLLLNPFMVIGVASHYKPFNVSWDLNRILDINLTMQEPLQLYSKVLGSQMQFTQYISPFHLEEQIFFLENQSQFGLLLEKAKVFQYLLILSNKTGEISASDIISKIKTSEMILLAAEVEIKSKSEIEIISLLNI